MGRGELPLECIVDAHTHLARGMDPRVVLENVYPSGPRGAVILGIPRIDSVLAGLDVGRVRAEYERAEAVLGRLNPGLAGEGPESMYLASLRMAKLYAGVQPEARPGEGLAALAGVDLSMGRDELLASLGDLASQGFRGFKVISTLYMKYLDDPSVEAVFEAASYLGVPIAVHAGCDPGVWELPGFCKYGNPDRLEGILEGYREVPVIIANIGGYSAFAPSVFTQEAVELAKRYPNVYLDTSAVPGHIIEAAAKSLPPGKLVYGSDYPVADTVDAPLHASIVWRALVSAGYSRGVLEETFHGVAEELFGVRCLDWSAAD